MVIDMERMKGEQAGRRTALEAIDSLQLLTRMVLASIRQTMHTLRGEPVNVPDLADWLYDLLERFHSETGIETRLMGQESWPSTLSTHASINLFRIVEEALHNVRLHSGARLVLVSLSMDGGTARLYVRDDGRGRANIDRSWWQGSGTVGMKERAILLGGELRVEGVFEHGVAIELRIPADSLTPLTS
jgi:signal transduction histidine kinase